MKATRQTLRKHNIIHALREFPWFRDEEPYTMERRDRLLEDLHAIYHEDELKEAK